MLMSGDNTDVAADVSYTSSKHIVAHSGLQNTTNILNSKAGNYSDNVDFLMLIY